MKRYSWPSMIFMLMIYTISYGAIITVDNKYPYVGQYRTLQEAHDAANADDVIYVSPSQIPYAAITVVKPLTFYGVGFDIASNTGGAYTTTTSLANTMIFVTGSQGSLLQGFDGSFKVGIINTANITIRRNSLDAIDIGGSYGCAISQNRIITGREASTISIDDASSDILINNNIVINIQPNNQRAISGGVNLLIINNIIRNMYEPVVATNGSQLINNIFLTGAIGGYNNSIRFNIFLTSWATTWGNQSNVDPNTVFVDYPNNNFHLRPGSPALGTGENGVDIGIYGGDAPYIDGGFPSLPSILQLKGDLVAAPGSGLNVQFKAKSNK